MTLDDYRRFYAEEIEQVASLTSPALVEAFAWVPREQFLGRRRGIFHPAKRASWRSLVWASQTTAHAAIR
ncbi:MAG TPA: hypothetical protein VMR62_12015 [Bryobacteraceae bacterium]|jgi:protein-L-isoaspartate O-methyltransferase|nr:hypothetical protein [Bryobacteraceae bacterium]